MDPYKIIKQQYVTEKARLLENLKHMDSNASLARFEHPKYVFLVDPKANKCEIRKALEMIYAEHKIKVVKVNTISVKQKPRRVRGRLGKKAGFKKAVVTLEKKDNLEDL